MSSAKSELIIVNIEPKVPGRGPMEFEAKYDYDAKTVTSDVRDLHGHGALYGANGYVIGSSAKRILPAGEYTFVCQPSKPQGQPTSPQFDTPIPSLFPTPQKASPINPFRGDAMDIEPDYVVKRIIQATQEDVKDVLAYLSFKLVKKDPPKVPAGTPSCPKFEPNENVNFGRALAEHHKLCLGLMKLNMGKDGFDVVELNRIREFLMLIVGNLKFIGNLDSALTHYGTASQILAGFVQKNNSKMNRGDEAAGSKKDLLESHEPTLVISMLAAIYMANRPLDFVSTDGTTFNLYRFHGRELLKYEAMSATEAYYTLAERVKEMVVEGKALPAEWTEAQRTLRRML